MRFVSIALMAIVGAGLFYGCNKAEDAADEVQNYVYGGPGSEWSISLSSASTGNFTVTCADSAGGTTALEVNGTYQKLSSGFVKLTVSDGTVTGTPTSCPGTAPSANDIAYGLEIPGFTFMLKPLGSGEIIPMVIKGQCASTDMNMNWIVTNYGGSDPYSTGADIFGTFSYTATSGTASIPTKYNLVNYGAISDNFSMTGTCSNGYMQMSANGSVAADMYITSLGGALVRTGHDGGIIVGTPQAEITQTALAGTHTGLMFDENNTSDGSDGSVSPIQVTVDSTGTNFTAVDFTDVDAGTTSSTVATAAVTAVNDPSNGFIKLTLTVGGQTSNMACSAVANVVNSGKNMIFCAAVHPGATSKLFNVLLVSQ